MSFLGSNVAARSRGSDESLVYQFNSTSRITVSVAQDQIN